MTNLKSTEKVVSVKEVSAIGQSRLSFEIENLKNRDVSRRGPFVITDEDLNEQFEINN